MFKVLVTDALSRDGLDFLASQPDVQTDVRTGLKGEELADAVRQSDALIVRSGTQVTADVLASPGRLRVVARAGVGVDNIDLEAATGAGVLVLNTPDANTISTAELTMAHMLALSRKVVPACVSTKSGEWQRKLFQGTQLAGKTLGIVGYGRIGRTVAERALAMKMRVIAYDPFFPGTPSGEVEFCDSVDTLVPQCDILSVHAPLTPDTEGIIAAAQLALAKPALIVINCARGGIIDEAALADAIRSGQVAGAGIDAFSTEPPTGNPLVGLENVLVTPHLGASTVEAQAGVAMEACRAILAFLRKGDIHGAVNIGGVDLRLDDYGKSLADLSRRVGALLSKLSQGPLRRLKVTLAGERAQGAGSACTRLMLVELLRAHLDQRVNVVNAAQIARQRNLAVEVVQLPESQHREDQIEAHVTSEEAHSIVGSVAYDGLPHVWQIDGYRMDMIPEGQMVLLANDDRPGVIGIVGTIFGDARVNIADMTISRQGDRAMMAIRIDGQASRQLLDQLQKAEPILWVEAVDLPSIDRRNGPRRNG